MWRSVLTASGNNICADCALLRKNGLPFLCAVARAFLCERCAEAHGAVGFRVLKTDSPEVTDSLKSALGSYPMGANNQCRKIYMDSPEVEAIRPKVYDSEQKYLYFVKAVYVDKNVQSNPGSVPQSGRDQNTSEQSHLLFDLSSYEDKLATLENMMRHFQAKRQEEEVEDARMESLVRLVQPLDDRFLLDCFSKKRDLFQLVQDLEKEKALLRDENQRLQSRLSKWERHAEAADGATPVKWEPSEYPQEDDVTALKIRNHELQTRVRDLTRQLESARAQEAARRGAAPAGASSAGRGSKDGQMLEDLRQALIEICELYQQTNFDSVFWELLISVDTAMGCTLTPIFESILQKRVVETQEHFAAESGTQSVIQTYESKLAESAEFYKTALERQVQEMNASLQQMAAMYQQEKAIKALLYNEVIELRGNIRVYARVRPFNSNDQGRVNEFFSYDDTSVQLGTPMSLSRFELDRVFAPDDTQETVFSEVSHCLDSVLDGYNLCIFAYGQTGSGKTYTMHGTPENPGVSVRALEYLVDLAASRKNVTCYYEISVMEIYLDTIYDLIGASAQSKHVVTIRMNEDRKYEPRGSQSVQFTSSDEAISILQNAIRNRSTRSHALNDESSRSHLVVLITVTSETLVSHKTQTSTLTLIDLAGSERILRTNVQGDAKDEALRINKSLSALGNVISALGNRSRHIPYRDSPLTFLLKESLCIGSKVVMFVNLTPDDASTSETGSSLSFAKRCHETELAHVGSERSNGILMRVHKLEESFKSTTVPQSLSFTVVPWSAADPTERSQSVHSSRSATSASAPATRSPLSRKSRRQPSLPPPAVGHRLSTTPLPWRSQSMRSQTPSGEPDRGAASGSFGARTAVSPERKRRDGRPKVQRPKKAPMARRA